MTLPIKRIVMAGAMGCALMAAALLTFRLSETSVEGRLKTGAAFVEYEFTYSSPRRQAAGERTFEWYCSSCHGVNPTNISSFATRTFSQFGDFDVWRQIRAEQPNGDMQSFAFLGHNETFDIVAYLRKMQERPVESSPEAQPPLDGTYKYVALDGSIRVYDIDDGYSFVKQIRVPGELTARGIAAHAGTKRLYVSFDGSAGHGPVSALVAIDLVTDRIVWLKEYRPGIDSMGVSPDGRTIYMPTGESLGENDRGEWLILDALTGDIRKHVRYGKLPHNVIVGPDGGHVYLAPAGTPWLGVLDASTEEIVGQIGPFGNNVRPVALTSDGAFAFVNINLLSGFEVADLRRGTVIHQIKVAGFPWEDPPLPTIQSHGVALNPDETEVWVSDRWNKYVHVFDVTTLPDRPRQIASIDVTRPDRPDARPYWINFSRDGHYAHVSNGAIVDAASRTVVTWVAPSFHFVEVHFRQGDPVAAFSRYGLGYRDSPRNSPKTQGAVSPDSLAIGPLAGVIRP
jgi:DNA-binding beta-propeller fold protein YncE/mono/diheme cytochrome c family protein